MEILKTSIESYKTELNKMKTFGNILLKVNKYCETKTTNYLYVIAGIDNKSIYTITQNKSDNIIKHLERITENSSRYDKILKDENKMIVVENQDKNNLIQSMCEYTNELIRLKNEELEIM